jgi:hypothetical protein
MAYFAEIDENNIVVQVLITDDNDPKGDQGYQWLLDNLGGRWIKTCKDTFRNENPVTGIPIRGNYASVGMSYNEGLDVFLLEKPFPSWVLDETIMMWESPVTAPPFPAIWDEPSLSWVATEQ